MYRSSKLMNSTRTIAKVVTISSDALKKVVSDGILTVDSEAVNDKLNVFEGMKFDRGYIFPYFMNTAKGIVPGFSDKRQDMAIAISSLRLYSTKTGTVTTETGTSKPNLINRVWLRIFNSKSGSRGLSPIIDFNEESRASQNLDHMIDIFEIPLDLHKVMKEKDTRIEKLVRENETIQINLDILRKEMSLIKSPAAAKSKIEFFERENGLSHYDLTEDEKKIIMKISDLKERKIKAVEFKWLFLLSAKNPNYKLQMNQDLLRIFHEKGISIDRACRAIAVTFEYTASRWHELFDMNGEPVVVLKVKEYDDIIQCFF